jgi:hypothetical protein
MYGGVSSLGKISRPLHDTYQDINRLLTGVLDPTSFLLAYHFLLICSCKDLLEKMEDCATEQV